MHWAVGVILPVVVVLAYGGTAVKSNDYSETVATFVFRFIRDHKGLKQGIVFGCDQKLLLIYKVLSQLATIGVRTRTVSIDRASYNASPVGVDGLVSSTLRRSLEFHQFVLLDMDCANAPDVLEQVSGACLSLYNGASQRCITCGPLTNGNHKWNTRSIVFILSIE
uniref:Receptor ligand binding region domain-containing protein n=1 Tax=Anopheles culicifacies TaxID=139723 RepID=A0A182M526_9DIPT